MVYQEHQPKSSSAIVKSVAFVIGIESFKQDIQSDHLVNQIFKAIEIDAAPVPTNDQPKSPTNASDANTSCEIASNASMKKAKVDYEQRHAGRNPHRRKPGFRERLTVGNFSMPQGGVGRRSVGILVIASCINVRVNQGVLSCDKEENHTFDGCPYTIELSLLRRAFFSPWSTGLETGGT